MPKLDKATEKIITEVLAEKPSEFPDRDALLKVWNTNQPHFDGIFPHRYDREPHCVYCGRPMNWQPN